MKRVYSHQSRPADFLLSILLYIPFILSLAAPATWAEEGLQKPQTPVKVRVQQVHMTPVHAPVETVGTIRAEQEAAISARVNGVITAIQVHLGDRVHQGDVLVRLEAKEIGARVRRAKAELAQARRNLAREKKLLQKHASTMETVKSLKDLVAVAEAGFQEANSMLDYTTIRAPFDGVITAKIANRGDLAAPGHPLLRLADDGHLQVVSAIPEHLVGLIHGGDTLAVTVAAAGVELQGTVAEIAPAVDPASRTARVKLDIPARPGLRLGQFARVHLGGPEVKGIVIPEQAVVTFGQMDKVFVAHDQHAWLRLVRTGFHANGQVEILAGLNPGDSIIISNNQTLVNGTPITILP